MGLFRKSEPEVVATGAEIDIAAKALTEGDQHPADALCARAGGISQRVAMAVLAASVDHTKD